MNNATAHNDLGSMPSDDGKLAAAVGGATVSSIAQFARRMVRAIETDSMPIRSGRRAVTRS